MKRSTALAVLLLPMLTMAGCSDPKPRVHGSMKFVLGGTSGVFTALRETPSAASPSVGSSPTSSLVAGLQYIVSPRKAKVTFASVVFVDGAGLSLGNSDFTDCVVTYDRSLTSGSVLLDCPFTVPVGDIAEMRLNYNTTLQLIVSDATLGIYSNPAASTGFSTTAPAGGAAYVPYTVTIGTGTTRGLPVIFATPVTVTEGSTPTLYATLDMIHTVQLAVNSDGTTLTPNATNEPVVVFGGLTPGSSWYYSGAANTEGYLVQGVPSLRVFRDQAGKPLYVMIGPNFCGADGGPKNAWATAPTQNKTGGWLGEDAGGVLAFALATSSAWTSYASYYRMTDVSTVGQTTTLLCQATATPPPPVDGKTYASGAPAMAAPTSSVQVRLLSK
jgi:hypothetical protein